MVKMVENLEEFNAIVKASGGKLVVVDFTAQWCGPCKMIAPLFEELSKDPAYTDVVFLKVDVDDASDVSAHWKIQSMPTFLFLRNGEKLHQFSGANINKLKETIQNLK